MDEDDIDGLMDTAHDIGVREGLERAAMWLRAHAKDSRTPYNIAVGLSYAARVIESGALDEWNGADPLPVPAQGIETA